MVQKTDEEIEEVLQQCDEEEENGSAYPGMSYEDGVKETINWLTNDGEHPFD